MPNTYTPEQIEQAKKEAQLLIDIYGSAHGQIFFCTDDGKKHDIGAIVKVILAVLEDTEKERDERIPMKSINLALSCMTNSPSEEAIVAYRNNVIVHMLVSYIRQMIEPFSDRAERTEAHISALEKAGDAMREYFIHVNTDEAKSFDEAKRIVKEKGGHLLTGKEYLAIHAWDAARKEKPQ